MKARTRLFDVTGGVLIDVIDGTCTGQRDNGREARCQLMSRRRRLL